MNPHFRTFLAVLLGIIIGSIVNMALISLSPNVIPPPTGANMTTTEGLKASMHLMEPKHFIFPFLAHALGTLAGAYVAGWFGKKTMRPALIVGIFFLLGGIASVLMLPSPIWFTLLDLIAAYLPMAYLGGKLAQRIWKK